MTFSFPYLDIATSLHPFCIVNVGLGVSKTEVTGTGIKDLLPITKYINYSMGLIRVQ